MPHDIIPTWQRVRDLTADRDSWRSLAESREHLAGQNAKVIQSLWERISILKAKKKRPVSVAVKRLRSELAELKKQIRRLERITHCKECRCKDNPRKAEWAARYLKKKAERQQIVG